VSDTVFGLALSLKSVIVSVACTDPKNIKLGAINTPAISVKTINKPFEIGLDIHSIQFIVILK
jgi:hypothetical protein